MSDKYRMQMAEAIVRIEGQRDALQQDLNQRDEQIATLDLQREAHLRNSQVAERRVAVLEGLLSSGSALGDVHLERIRQIDVENRSPVDDDDYSPGQLAYAAAGYAQGSVPAQQVQGCLRPSYWPWHPCWWKPGSPRRMLVKAAALILAEIERIDRAALKPAEGGGGDTAQDRAGSSGDA